MENIRVLISEISREQRSEIIETLTNVEYITLVGEADSLETTFDLLEKKQADVILIGCEVEGDGYKVSEKVNLDYPEVATVIIEKSLREDILHKALFSGANDVLVHPFTPTKLVDTIYRCNELLKRKSGVTRQKTSKGSKSSRIGKVMTIFSTKGGVGKTFIATNLAVAIQRGSGKRVVVVDLDLDFGNVALALNITPKFTLADVVEDIKNIDQDLIESYLIQHPSGISILPANAKPQITEFVNGEHVQVILRTLQKAFDYVIVDMPARFYEPINPSFVIADKLLMVTTPEIATIRNVKSALNTLNELNYPKSKIKVLLNRSDSKGLIKIKDVEATLNQEIYSSISFDYKTAVTSLNQGISVLEKGIRKGMAKEFITLAKKVINE